MDGTINDSSEILLRIEHLLKAILKTRVSRVLEQIHGNSVLRRVYEMTGSDKTISKIAKAAGVSTGKVSGLWQSWEASGLIIKVGKSYRKLVE